MTVIVKVTSVKGHEVLRATMHECTSRQEAMQRFLNGWVTTEIVE